MRVNTGSNALHLEDDILDLAGQRQFFLCGQVPRAPISTMACSGSVSTKNVTPLLFAPKAWMTPTMIAIAVSVTFAGLPDEQIEQADISTGQAGQIGGFAGAFAGEHFQSFGILLLGLSKQASDHRQEYHRGHE